MEELIFEPEQDFNTKYCPRHMALTERFLDDLTIRSGIDIEENRHTVKQYHLFQDNLKKLKRKLNWFRVLRVFLCITVIFIPLVFWKVTPIIQALREDVHNADKKVSELYAQALAQMEPLNRLFTDRDCLHLITSTIPMLTFEDCFHAKQEADMQINYDFSPVGNREQSTTDLLAGHFHGNPFLFENRVIHTMGTETYHGSKTIHWTETYRDSDGHLQTRSRSETLHASVTKPKPFYTAQIVLNYCAQGGPELCFSRDATHLEQKSDKQIERYVKSGEKRIKKLADKAIADNLDFTSMANSDFEVLFDALDRNNEVQFRTLFTPLAQINMVKLLLSKNGFGDDFHFIKRKRTNLIISGHSQSRPIQINAGCYRSFSYDITRDRFLSLNQEYFKQVYFDFAPLWAIPVYQEQPVQSLKPIPALSQHYALKENEALANSIDTSHLVHPSTKTQAILKSQLIRSDDTGDTTRITAYSYDIHKRVDVVSVHGGDGYFHDVEVPWDEYIPLEESNLFRISEQPQAGQTPLGQRNKLYISKIT